MLDREQIVELANAQAKAYFQFMGEPSWTAKYQFEYPIFVDNFVREYTKMVKREKRKNTTKKIN